MLQDYRAALVDQHDALPGASLDWLKEYRDHRLSRFLDVGFPTRKVEQWKYTDVSQLEKLTFQFALDDKSITLPTDLKSLPSGVVLCSLSEALQKQSAMIKPYFDLQESANPFVDMNGALMSDGFFLYVPDGVTIEQPIHVVNDSNQQNDTVMRHLRHIIILGANAKVSVLDEYRSDHQGQYFNNIVTEIYAGAGAHLNHYKIQSESQNAFHIANTLIKQERSSCVRTFNLSLGGALARDDLVFALKEPGATCYLNGLYLLEDGQHIDHHTHVDHLTIAGTSHECYKGILTGKSKSVFNGKVMVHKDAQQTSAHQTNQNLLLSKTADVNTKPELEIYADDVKCTHGATVGQLDEKAIFYLRSRGVEKIAAIGLLTRAFANEVVDFIDEPVVKARVEELVNQKLGTML